MADERGRGHEGARQSRGASPGAEDPGDAAPFGAVGPGSDDEGGRRDAEHDFSDAVPSGVAPLESPEPTDEDRRVLEKLRDLPRRG